MSAPTLLRRTVWTASLLLLSLLPLRGWAVAAEALPVDLAGNWQYRWGDSPLGKEGTRAWASQAWDSPGWLSSASTENIPGRNGQKFLWLRVRIPAGEWRDPSLYVHSFTRAAEVFLDGAPLYRFGAPGVPSRISFSGFPYHLIRLPAGSAGSILAFRIWSDWIGIGIAGRVAAGERADLVTQVNQRDMDSFILGALLILIAILPFLLILARPRRGAGPSGELPLSGAPFGLFAFTTGIYILVRSPVKQLFADAPLAWVIVEVTTLCLIPVFIALFFERTIGAGPWRVVRRIWQVHLAYIGLCVILVPARVMSIPNVYQPIMYLLMADAVILGAIVVRAAIRGSFEARVFTVGFLLAALFALWDVLTLLRVIPYIRLVSDWGLFLFVLSFGVLLVHRVLSLYREIDVMAENASDIIYRWRPAPRERLEYISPAVTTVLGRTPEECMQDPGLLFTSCHPEDEPKMRRAFAGEHTAGAPLLLRWRRPDGALVWTEHSIVPAGAGVIEGIARDVTARVKAETEVRTHLLRLSALRAIDSAITGSLDLGVTLAIFLDQVTSQLGVDAADILLLASATQTLEFAAGRGFRSLALRHTHLRIGTGLAGMAALQERTVRVDDLGVEAGELSRSPLLREEGFVTYFAVPLVAKGQTKGVLEVFHRTRLEPDREWTEFLESLAGQAAIAVDNSELFRGLQQSNLEIRRAYDATIEGWSRALDLRDRETEGHTQRVTEVTVRLARLLEIGDGELVHVYRGALLHDIGKMGIPDAILLKPGPLSDQEWVVMRNHPAYAFEMLAPIAYLQPALSIPYCHHEKWDGSGYPRGLRADAIPLSARLFSVVDVWDALRSDRPYRLGWPEEKVREHIRALSGTHFDPQAVDAFLTLDL